MYHSTICNMVEVMDSLSKISKTEKVQKSKINK